MSLLSLLLIAIASGLLIGGAAWIYPPAGVLMAGALLMVAAVDTARDLPTSKTDR